MRFNKGAIRGLKLFFNNDFLFFNNDFLFFNNDFLFFNNNYHLKALLSLGKRFLFKYSLNSV